GAGMKKTRLISRFTMEGKQPEIHGVEPGGVIGPTNFVYGWVDPKEMTEVTLEANGKLVKSTPYSGYWDVTVLHRYTGAELLAAVGPGKTKLKLTVVYRDGSSRSVTRKIELTDETVPGARAYGTQAVILFRGEGVQGNTMLLTRDAHRG